MESLLIITGTMGSGKTSVMSEASDMLARRGFAHAAIDLDALGLAHLPSGAARDGVMYRNLQCVCKNYSSLGVKRMLVARAIETRAELERCSGAVSAAKVIVCRLIASMEVMKQRVMARELGISRESYIARVAKLNDILERAQLEHFTIANESSPLTDVAQELLVKAQWI